MNTNKERINILPGLLLMVPPAMFVIGYSHAG